MSIIFFIDDELFISQSKLFHTSNCRLFCSYNIMSNLLEKFSLIVEHSKTDVFHFNRSQDAFNPPPLDLTPLGETILCPKNTWKYIDFIFNRKLLFHQHVNFYSNKAMSIVKCMKILSTIQTMVSIQLKSAFFMGHVFSPLHYTGSNYGSTIAPPYRTT